METTQLLKIIFKKDDKIGYLYQMANLGEITEKQFKELFYAIYALMIQDAPR